jgi:hypothetical protein
MSHAQRAWDFFTGSNALTRDSSVNMTGLANVIATLVEAGLLPPATPKDPSIYVIDEYLEEARATRAATPP